MTEMIDLYFKTYTECIEKYGKRTVVLHQTGSFYEMYKVENENEKIGNADEIAEIINIAYSKKNKIEKSTRSHPNFAGFTKMYLSKYITPLLENDYTIVIVDELEKSSEAKGKLIKRGITAVYSQCLKSPDFQTSRDTENNLTSIFLEKGYCNKKECLFYSICSVNNITNEIELNENIIEIDSKIILDELSRVLSRYNSKEILCYYIVDKKINCAINSNNVNNANNVNNKGDYSNQILKFLYELETKHKYIEIESDDVLYKEYSKIKYQNEYLKKVYTHIDFGMEDSIHYMFIENMPLSRINLVYTLDYMSKYDSKYIVNLNTPKIINEEHNLVLELNTSDQLHLLPNNKINSFTKISSVFDVVNFTKTAIGKRYLKNLLVKPFIDEKIIQKRYDLSDFFSKINQDKFIEIESILDGVIDFERLHRKMGLNMLHPYEFEKLHNTYMKILLSIENIKSLGYENLALEYLFPSNEILSKFIEYIDNYKICFNLEEMKRITLSTNKDEIVNFFHKDIVVELDTIQNNIDIIQNDIEKIRNGLEETLGKSIKNKINGETVTMIKLNFSDTDGYYFSCTKIRYSKLVNEHKNTQFTMKSTSNMCKFTTSELTKLSTRLIVTRDLLVKRVKMHYLLKLEEYSKKYHSIFKEITLFIQLLDTTISNVKCSKKYLYCKPEIKESNQDSFVKAVSLRHPIIERICDTEYIPNDINLDQENTGILLYGLNSSGKSSLLRALGICIVLAQCGLYVPCKNMIYFPFKTMISQVDLSDNLFVGKSSFISEMTGLKKILNCVGKNTLVLSDELCRGTEVNSSCAIVTSCLLSLQKSNTKFFFTSHLHQIATLPIIQKIKNIKICHLDVTTRDNNNNNNNNNNNDIIIFNRTIKEGSGSDLYGLEVCRSIVNNDLFIDSAFNIRNEIIGNKTKVLSTKKSRYNNKKIISECEVCGYKPKDKSIPLDTHHINEQKNCDKSGFVKDKSFHKNESFNLVSLCKPCHLKIDTGELIINGYVSSTSGKILDFTIN